MCGGFQAVDDDDDGNGLYRENKLYDDDDAPATRASSGSDTATASSASSSEALVYGLGVGLLVGAVLGGVGVALSRRSQRGRAPLAPAADAPKAAATQWGVSEGLTSA